ncbi:MAG: flavin-dependent dehydrogenase [Planctomycetota bacterium]|jgi:flavin-dependent dehydrogenase
MSESNQEDFDVIVIGAGPAGTTAAALLAKAGRRVALVEKDPSPRYRVGESLIPHCWHALDRLGLVEKIADSDFVVEKNSVQFIGRKGNVSKPFYFFEHTDHACARTWQVRREEFDSLLLNNALERGANYFPHTTVEDFLREGDRIVGVAASRRVEAKAKAGAEAGAAQSLELRAPVTIDASGRDAIAQTKHSWRVPDKQLRKMSVWTYFEGGLRDEGVDEGTTTIAYLPEEGWFWYIPLSGNRVSVGIVAEKDYLFRGSSDLLEIFEREVAIQPWIAERLKPARRLEDCRVTSDFSYASKEVAADGLVLVGDAFAFLDPVFSSGVYFALTSAVMAADAVLEALEAGDTSAQRFSEYGRRYQAQIEPMRKLVYAFYDGDFNFGSFLKKNPDLRRDLTDILIGDLERDYTPFFAAMDDFVGVS